MAATSEVQLNIIRVRTLTLAGNALLDVLAAAPNATFTFPRQEVDVRYIAVATPSWNTTVYISSKTVDDCVFTFGTAPAGAETLNVIIMRSES